MSDGRSALIVAAARHEPGSQVRGLLIDSDWRRTKNGNGSSDRRLQEEKSRDSRQSDGNTAGRQGARTAPDTYGFGPLALVSTGIYETRNCTPATRLPREQELSSTSLQRLSATKTLTSDHPLAGNAWCRRSCSQAQEPDTPKVSILCNAGDLSRALASCRLSEPQRTPLTASGT